VQALSSADIFLFEGFCLDWRGLLQGYEDAVAAPVEIGSRALEVLRALIERPGDLLSRHEIMAAAWPGMLVDDNNLTIQIAALRRLLDHGRIDGSCIVTVPGRGYRFVAPVTRIEPWDRPLRPALRLSIVVLPFSNLSDDPGQQYFADGITEDLTTDLSRLPHMFVISRNTAFTYRNKRTDTRQTGVELGASYVLQGSVQRSGNQVRVSAQLIDAATDTHLWAERFDSETGDLFALQNEITGRIASELNIELIAAEAARPTDNPEALDYAAAELAEARRLSNYHRYSSIAQVKAMSVWQGPAPNVRSSAEPTYFAGLRRAGTTEE
jgi:TolB-like protein